MSLKTHAVVATIIEGVLDTADELGIESNRRRGEVAAQILIEAFRDVVNQREKVVDSE